jgi:hypothetical protein
MESEMLSKNDDLEEDDNNTRRDDRDDNVVDCEANSMSAISSGNGDLLGY